MVLFKLDHINKEGNKVLPSLIISEIAQYCYLPHTTLSANQARPGSECFLLTLSRYQESENNTLGTRLQRTINFHLELVSKRFFIIRKTNL